MMSSTPKQNITADQAMEVINSGRALNDVFVSGQLDLTKCFKDKCEKEVIADNCIFESFEGSSVQFVQLVKLTNSKFIKCRFLYTYFLGGLIIDNCIFEGYLDMQAGGHNKKAVSITNSTFKNFVNFFDCWYQGEVVIRNNHFQKGTNLLGAHTTSGIRTNFDVQPIIERNKGQLDIDGEADLEINIINL